MSRRIIRGRSLSVALTALLALAALCLPTGAGAYVYWTNSASNSIGRANLDGSSVNQSFISVSIPTGVAVDASHIFWTESLGSNQIGRANLDGSGVNESFITGAFNPAGVAVNGAYVYWANEFADTRIGRANLNGSSPNQSFITGASDPCGVAIDGSYVYWANSGGGTGTTIGRANLDGSSPDQSFITGASGPCGVAVDDNYIYWANNGPGTGTTIGRANLNGSSPDQSFITGASGPDGVTVDGSHIYWANAGSGTIGRANLNGSSGDQSFITGASGPVGLAVDSLGPSNQTPGPGAGKPSNAFTIGKVKKGRLRVTLASAGTVRVIAMTPKRHGKHGKRAHAKPKAIKLSRASGGPGELKVRLKLTRFAKAKLKHQAKLRFKAMVTFTPTGGDPNAKASKLTLRGAKKKGKK